MRIKMKTEKCVVVKRGVTEEEFAESFEFVRKMRFANLHVFSYSKRAGTPAATMKNQIPDAVKKIRHQQLEKLNLAMKEDFIKSQRGKTLPVIFETVDKSGIAHGWSDNYIAVTAPATEVKSSVITAIKF